MGWWKDFANSLVETTAAGLTSSLATGVSGEKSGLGSMLSEGTQSDFDKYVSARQAAVKGEYDKYTQKFDAFEEQAKQFAGLVGSPSSQNLGTELDGMEVAARYMQGKSQAQINDTIAQLKKLKAEGKNIREVRPDLFKRGADQEIRNYTAQDIARMQLGGAFSYTPKPYDLSKRRTGLARFLRDDLGLYGETFAKEREAVAERQARDITAALPGYDKYAGTGGARYTQTQAAFDFGAGDLRTEEQRIAQETTKLNFEELKRNITRNQTKFDQDIKNAQLLQQVREGELTDAKTKREVEKKERELQDAKDILAGRGVVEAAAKARTDYLKNKNPETLAALRESRQNLYSFNATSNFYKTISDKVTSDMALDKKFTSSKQEGDKKIPTVGEKTITAYTPAQARAEQTRLWKENTYRLFNTLNPDDQEVVNLKAIQPFVGEAFTNDMRDFAKVMRSGKTRTEEGSSIEMKLKAGMEATSANLGKEAYNNKFRRMVQFAKDRGLLEDPNRKTRKDTQQKDKKIQPSDVDVGDVNRRFTVPEGTGSEEGLSAEDIARAERLRDRRKGQIKNLMGQMRMMNEDGKARVRGLIGTYETEIDNLVRKYGIER